MVLSRLKPMGLEAIIRKENDTYHIYYFYTEDRPKIEELLNVQGA